MKPTLGWFQSQTEEFKVKLSSRVLTSINNVVLEDLIDVVKFKAFLITDNHHILAQIPLFDPVVNVVKVF